MTIISTEPVELTPDARCPYCNAEINRATSASGAEAPSPGDLSLCVYCQGLSVFSDDLTFRKITDEERASIDEETQGILNDVCHTLNRIKNASPFYH